MVKQGTKKKKTDWYLVNLQLFLDKVNPQSLLYQKKMTIHKNNAERLTDIVLSVLLL